MSLTNRDWQSITAEIEARIPGSQFVLDTVAERDEKHKFVYVSGFPGVPIPLVGFRGKVKYYDHDGTAVQVKKAEVEVEVPQIGATVLIVRGLGPSGTARCLGVILSTGYMVGSNGS